MIYKIIDYVEDVTKTDDFLEMPHSTQSLYFHLSRVADNDGITDNTKATIRAARCTEEDLQRLIKEKFVEELQAEG